MYLNNQTICGVLLHIWTLIFMSPCLIFFLKAPDLYDFFQLCFECVCRKQTSVSMLWEHLGKVVSRQFILLAEEDPYR